MRQAREAATGISRWPSGDLSMFARIFRASHRGHAGNRTQVLGLNQQPARSGSSGCSLRRCSSSRVPPPGCQFIRPRRVVSRHWSLRAA
jgi:hypothetical protein